jgi:hypothetical protein
MLDERCDERRFIREIPIADQTITLASNCLLACPQERWARDLSRGRRKPISSISEKIAPPRMNSENSSTSQAKTSRCGDKGHWRLSTISTRITPFGDGSPDFTPALYFRMGTGCWHQRRTRYAVPESAVHERTACPGSAVPSIRSWCQTAVMTVSTEFTATSATEV